MNLCLGSWNTKLQKNWAVETENWALKGLIHPSTNTFFQKTQVGVCRPPIVWGSHFDGPQALSSDTERLWQERTRARLGIISWRWQPNIDSRWRWWQQSKGLLSSLHGEEWTLWTASPSAVVATDQWDNTDLDQMEVPLVIPFQDSQLCEGLPLVLLTAQYLAVDTMVPLNRNPV